MYMVKNASKVPITVIITTIKFIKDIKFTAAHTILRGHNNFRILSKVMATI
jgi:hypothetical protein